MIYAVEIQAKILEAAVVRPNSGLIQDVLHQLNLIPGLQLISGNQRERLVVVHVLVRWRRRARVDQLAASKHSRAYAIPAIRMKAVEADKHALAEPGGVNGENWSARQHRKAGTEMAGHRYKKSQLGREQCRQSNEGGTRDKRMRSFIGLLTLPLHCQRMPKNTAKHRSSMNPWKAFFGLDAGRPHWRSL